MKMADKFKTSNHQKQQENADEPVQKRHKPNERENLVDTVEPKKITNIYYDCLERIFDFLDLESLLMVAQTCKRLQIAAAAKFGDEFGKKRILLDPSEPEPEVIVDQDEVEVFGLKLCLAFLRCFGAKISDLFVDYTPVYSKAEGYLDQYINQYCADTLTSIEFEHKWPFSNQTIQKPFKNVEKVKLCYGNLENHLSNFVNWFPNLRHLAILDCLIDGTAPMNVSIPHLEHLQLSIDEYDFDTADAANLLQANPQLQSVKLCLIYEATLTTILDAIIANSLITKLQVENGLRDVNMDVSMDELNRFASEHQLVEELILSCYRLAAVDAINFIRQMKLLKQVEFQLKDRPECDRITQEFNNEWKSEISTTYLGLFHIKLNR